MEKTGRSRGVIVAISDTHGGHRLGLCNPNTEIEVEGSTGEIVKQKVGLNEPQEFLWETYLNGLKRFKELAGGDPIAVIHNGDIVQGNHFPREQIGTRIYDQILISYMNFLPIIEILNPRYILLSKGTGSHDLGEGSATMLLCKMLTEKYPGITTTASYHSKDKIFGLWIDYAHHGSMTGRRIWLRGNEMRYYLRDIMMGELALGKRPADVYLRGHYHAYWREFLTIEFHGDDYESWMINLPSLCFLGDYGVQATRSPIAIQVGMVAMEIIDGSLHKIHKHIESIDTRTTQELG